MKKSRLQLYPLRPDAGRDFKGSKIHTVPMQSMTLREIIRRFVRKESLPINREGVYHDGFGDLEKMQHEDLTYTYERIAQMKEIQKKWRDQEKAKAEGEAALPPPGPSGPVTGVVVGGQAPPPPPA